MMSTIFFFFFSSFAMLDRDEDLVEDIEQRTRKHKEDRERGEPKWEESLASNSEADVCRRCFANCFLNAS